MDGLTIIRCASLEEAARLGGVFSGLGVRWYDGTGFTLENCGLDGLHGEVWYFIRGRVLTFRYNPGCYDPEEILSADAFIRLRSAADRRFDDVAVRCPKIADARRLGGVLRKAGVFWADRSAISAASVEKAWREHRHATAFYIDEHLLTSDGGEWLREHPDTPEYTVADFVRMAERTLRVIE